MQQKLEGQQPWGGALRRPARVVAQHAPVLTRVQLRNVALKVNNNSGVLQHGCHRHEAVVAMPDGLEHLVRI